MNAEIQDNMDIKTPLSGKTEVFLPLFETLCVPLDNVVDTAVNIGF